MTGIAILGCGYISDMYRQSLAFHPDLKLRGVFDQEQSRAESLARLTGAAVYPDFAALCGDPSVEIVLNLTNPSAHYETTSALLSAGKHVYSEKPLADRLEDAMALVQQAEAADRMLVCAPCTLLNPVAQRVWSEVRSGALGVVRLVYAEMEDGMVHQAPTSKWVNSAGVVWPAMDEFQTGCTVEHAGYVLTWLCAMFGPVVSLTAHAEQLVADKVPGVALRPAPDFSVAVLRFRSGVVARMTNGLYATKDHAFRVFGDDGVLEVENPRADNAEVTVARYKRLRRRRFLWPIRRRWRARDLPGPVRKGQVERDALRAVADMASALHARRAPYAGAAFGLHVTEVALACHHGLSSVAPKDVWPGPMPYAPVTTFADLEPLT